MTDRVMSQASSRPRIYPMLDVFRVVAVTMVILLHTPSISRRLPVLRSFAPGFWLGVELFMLISGWLLGGMLIREAARSVRLDPVRFYVRRWFRTLPNYYAILATIFLIVVLSRVAQPSLNGAWFSKNDAPWVWAAHALFLQEYLGVERFAVSWSLCVEEHFYLVLPWLVPLLFRWKGRRAWALLVALALTPTVLRFFFPTPEAPTITHLRCEGLVVGVILALLAQEQGPVWRWIGARGPLLFGGGVIATLVLLYVLPHVPVFLQPSLGTLTMAPMVAAAVHDDSPVSHWAMPRGRYFGELTYSVYLTHSFVPAIVVPGLPARLVQLVALALLPLVLHHVVERPFLRLRDRLRAAPSSAKSTVAVAAAPPEP
jgi:peptidoglycan/LPS O-acetylase OafA/YrhL